MDIVRGRPRFFKSYYPFATEFLYIHASILPMVRTALITGFLSAHIMDIFSTRIAISDFHFQELNPIARALFGMVGMEAMMVIKLYVALFFILLYIYIDRRLSRWRRVLELSLQVGSVFMWIVVLINIAGILSSLRGPIKLF